ncbi:MAG TPA: hypothetical protein VEW46_25085 [Pyrinomonadaceae bacterium]|nr:hypothetical protein [Pyrinomonadaceae bacterium]
MHIQLSRHNRLIVILLGLLFAQYAAQAQGALEKKGSGKVVDSMIATVNGSLITYSDLIWQLTLEPATVLDNPGVEDLKRALELIVGQRIIHQDAEKLPHIHATEKEVDLALAELVRLFPSQAEFRKRMERTGLTTEKLREIVSERVDIEKYLDFRFRNFTIVTAKEIEEYYRDVYVPRFRLRSPQQIVPKLEQVRADIERTLEESKVESSLQKYLDDARERAEIVILNPL